MSQNSIIYNNKQGEALTEEMFTVISQEVFDPYAGLKVSTQGL